MSKQEFSWPSVKSVQNELNEFIERGVRLKHDEDIAKSDLNELAKDAKEKFDIPPSLFKSHVNASYDKDKFLSDLDAKKEIASNLGIEED